MAIVQVSRITNRKGLTENLPQLAGAEFGWCIDSRRLFIGNGTLQDGAPIIGNTEILTEFSDITVLSQYTYRDEVVGYAAQTGPTPSEPVVRSVQAKLDDFADVRDFGAAGDGTTDDTAAINRALFQLYCREINPLVRRTLYFPAGTYVVSDTIKIPSYAKLVGEGADCVFIQMDTLAYRNYVARYADSLQQIGANIGNNGATAPRNIEISSMTFKSIGFGDIFLVQDAQQCYFDSVNFVGGYNNTNVSSPSATFQASITNTTLTVTSVLSGTIAPGMEITGAGVAPGTRIVSGNGLVWTVDTLQSIGSVTMVGALDAIGVSFDSTNTNVCNQITFDKCRFSNVIYGINTDEQIQSVTVSNSKFATVRQGIVLGAGAPVNGGATGFRAVHNMFDDVYAEGIIYDDVSLNISAYNIFYNVGYNIGSPTPTHSIIRFGNDNNVSMNDMFERSDADALVYPRIFVDNGAAAASTAVGGTQIQLGRYARLNGLTQVLVNNTALSTVIATVNSDDIKAFSIDYTIVRDAAVRHGRMVVVPGPDDSSSQIQYSDDYVENSDTGITLVAVEIGNDITLEYTSTNTGSNGTLTYSLTHLA